MTIIKEIIEIFFSIALFTNAALFIPQILKLWRTKNAKGISLITFGGFNIIQLLAVLHGYFHSDYILVIGFTLSLITCGSITFLALLYKFKKPINALNPDIA